MVDDTDTGEKQAKAGNNGNVPPVATRFKPKDPRINRKGRPKSFDQWRKLNVAILNEVAKDKDGNPIVIDGHIATNAEMIARSKLKDPKHQNDVIEAAYGKVPQQLDVTTGGEKITVKLTGDDDGS